MRTLRSLTIILGLLGSIVPMHVSASDVRTSDGIIVSFDETLDRGAMKIRAKEIAQREGLTFDRCYVGAQFCVLRGEIADEHRAREKATAGTLDAAVVHVTPNDYLHLAAADPLLGQQWYLGNTGQDYVVGDLDGDGRAETTNGLLTNTPGDDIGWTTAVGPGTLRGEGTIVAVIDSGVSFGSADLPETARAPGGYNYLDDNEDVTDPHGHGTFIAGLIAAREDGTGMTGVAPKTLILPLRVADATGTATIAGSAAAILRAVEQGADVINFSLAGTVHAPELQSAVDTAVRAGVIFVAAAGNGNGSDTTYPGAYDGVISVGATVSDGRIAPFSNTNAHVDVVAPGAHILSLLAPTAPSDCRTRGVYAASGAVFAYPQSWSCHVDSSLAPAQFGAAFDIANGTSFSAPLVAGAAALLREQRGDALSSTAFEELLRTHSVHPYLPSGQRDDRFGYGRLSLPRLLGETGVAQMPSGFSDVPDTHFAATPIALLRTKGILQGRPDGRFQPEDTMTRAEFSKVLLGVRGEQPATALPTFVDVPAEHSLAGYVQRMLELGWAHGEGPVFHPDLQITRIEAARMIHRATLLAPGVDAMFTDLTDPEERVIAGALVTAGIFEGQDNLFMPQRAITRAEAAKVLARVLR